MPISGRCELLDQTSTLKLLNEVDNILLDCDGKYLYVLGYYDYVLVYYS